MKHWLLGCVVVGLVNLTVDGGDELLMLGLSHILALHGWCDLLVDGSIVLPILAADSKLA